mmetsp:Transcript_58771/g.131449  ORF Transcript_58771/g.131449 Transcript_58771/m.131449 type:complete len:488 (-) Transcript_58771:38-1501(-)
MRRRLRGLREAADFVCTLDGSVLHIAAAWALPSATAAVAIHEGMKRHDVTPSGEGLMDGFNAFSFVLGFLIVFRTQMAYQRFWEGARLLRLVRGQWMNAASCVVAFCSAVPEKQQDVEEFLHLFVRLMSLLFCTGLQQVADMSDETFEILDVHGFDEDMLRYLASRPEHERCPIVLQWIQRLIVITLESNTLQIAPPIASRIFQELGQGIMVLNQAGAITSVPFPFPYAQLMTVLLLIHTFVTPIVMAIVLPTWYWTAACTFASVLVFWGVNRIAVEIEMPFGDDSNDLQLKDMQASINQSLITLIDPMTQNPPVYKFNDGYRQIEHVLFDPDALHRQRPSEASNVSTSTVKTRAMIVRPRVSGVRNAAHKTTSVPQPQRARMRGIPIMRSSAFGVQAAESAGPGRESEPSRLSARQISPPANGEKLIGADGRKQWNQNTANDASAKPLEPNVVMQNPVTASTLASALCVLIDESTTPSQYAPANPL